jgi:N-acetylmuramoyl-L-alanine amidase
MVVCLALVLVACGSQPSSPSATPMPNASTTVSMQPSAGAGAGQIDPAPGSDSGVYAPNPGAIVVAIDPGHGGCLDWGVPDPSERGVELAEKTLTLEIAGRLRDRLTAEGIGVVMTRDGDDALAGDDYPALDCHGPPWRDVNGDGMTGFGDDALPEATRTRDELQARLDLANLAQADALVSIHINSPSEGGQSIEIAFSETFYTDETPWGADVTARLAELVEAGVVDRLDSLATYERGDRGTTAHNFYMVAPPLLEETEERPNRWAQPTRGGLMPVVLAEVGSITLRAEHDLLSSAPGQDAVAAGLFDALATFFGERELAGRIGLADSGPLQPDPVGGDGPPFWPPIAPDAPVMLRLTNTGTAAWASDMELVSGWEETDQPYLASAPDALASLDIAVPALAPGASVVVQVTLPPPPTGRGVAWISLSMKGQTLADRGSPALQLSSEGP